MRLKYAPEVLLLAALSFALLHSIRTTGDLDYSFNPDLYRDISTAESMLNGTYPDDSLYLDERAWYNPLAPGLVAAVSRFINQPVYLVYTRAGAYINLLVPLAFYLMVAYLFNRWTALISTLGYVFIVGNGAGSYYATYTPWLFPSDLGQGLFFLSITVYLKALRSVSLRWYALFGAVLGLTFLTHTAPALILGGIFALMSLREIYRRWDADLKSPELYRSLLRVMVVVGVALVVSSPLLMSIVGYYKMRVLNPNPVNYRSPLLDVSNLNQFIGSQLSLWTVIAAFGLFHVLRGKLPLDVRRILILWLVVPGGMLFYDYLVQILTRIGIPLNIVITSWHMLVYLEALKAVLFGYGLLVVVQLGLGMAHEVWQRVNLTPRTIWVTTGVVMLGLLIWRYPAYVEREYFGAARAEALKAQEVMTDRAGAFLWVREHTEVGDVFLTTDDHLSMFVVAQAGRKLVAAPPNFSNPYVNYEDRANDSNIMLTALRENDYETFGEYAHRYQVRYIVASGEMRETLAEINSPHLEQVYLQSDVVIYRCVLM